MPISQSRVIALINAALDCYQAVNTIRSHLSSRATQISQGYLTPEAAFHELNAIIPDNDQVFKRYHETYNVLTQELHWYRVHGETNVQKARMMRELRERRRADGMLPQPKRRRNLIPKSIGETNQLQDPAELGQKTPDYKPPTPELSIEEERDMMHWFDNPQPTHPLTIKPAFNPDNYKDDLEEKPQLPDDYDPSALPPPGSSIE